MPGDPGRVVEVAVQEFLPKVGKERAEGWLRYRSLSPSFLGALRAPATEQGVAHLLLDGQAGDGIVSAVQAGRVPVVTLTEAVFPRQA